MAPTKLLTHKLREHLRLIQVRCTVADVTRNAQEMLAAHPGKPLGQVCRECSEIVHRLGISL